MEDLILTLYIGDSPFPSCSTCSLFLWCCKGDIFKLEVSQGETKLQIPTQSFKAGVLKLKILIHLAKSGLQFTCPTLSYFVVEKRT